MKDIEEFNLMLCNINDFAKSLKEFNNDLDKIKVEIPLSYSDFNTIDEELYYRNNPNGKNFIPSDECIEIITENTIIHFIKHGSNPISNNIIKK